MLTAEETNITAKRYYYDCGIKMSDGSYQRIVKCSHFIVEPAVTLKGDVED